MEQPKVTFIIANYNYGRYLADAIESASKQDYPKNKLRINFIDDCSTDDSREVLKTKFLQDAKVSTYNGIEVLTSEVNGVELNVFLLPENKKQAYARNVGIRYSLADSDMFAILDADDINYKNKIARLSIEWSLLPHFVGAVYADYHTVNVDTQLMQYDYKKPYDKQLLHRECIVHSGSLISKKALLDCEENGWFFDPSLPPCEDYDMWLRISDKYMIIHVAEPLSLVRIHKLNCTFTISNDRWREQVQKVYTKAGRRHG